MQHDRRARPTLRLLREDLRADWGNVEQCRAVADGRWADLHPLAEVDHPIVRKAMEQLGSDPSADAAAGIIGCSGSLRLQEIRMSQWRAGVWTDPETGVRWVAVAGLAKGQHEDHDDFYQQLGARLLTTGEQFLLPTDLDQRLLTRETAAQALTRWELEIQTDVGGLLAKSMAGGTAQIEIDHPLRPGRVASIEIHSAVTRDDDGDYEEVVVEFRFEPRHKASELGWTLVERTLISLSPPVQSWDRFADTYSTINEIGHAADRIAEVHRASDREELLRSVLGTVSHYAHRNHLAESSVHAYGVRSLCGSYFVPSQDHEALPVCADCTRIFEQLPHA